MCVCEQVQLRDLETHLPLPGVRVGDIGPKVGYGGVDNGFLALDHVRIRECSFLRDGADSEPSCLGEGPGAKRGGPPRATRLPIDPASSGRA